MTNERMQLWQRLLEHGVVSEAIPAEEIGGSPWYVKFLLGLGGWVAAIFMFGFIVLSLELVINDTAIAALLGLVMMAIAYKLLSLKGEHEFVGQLLLATSFAGQGLLVFSLLDNTSFRNTTIWFAIAILQSALAWFMPNSFHRVWSAFAAATALSIGFTFSGIYFIPSSLLLLVVALLWLNEHTWPQYHRRVLPIAYGATIALIYQATTQIFYKEIIWDIFYYRQNMAMGFKPWMGEVLCSVVLIFVVWQLLARYRVAIPGRFAHIVLAGSLLLSLASLKAPGISVGLVIILLGFANGNRIVAGMGIASLLFYISSYYYQLQTTLLLKSQTLFVIGIILILARWLMHVGIHRNRGSAHE